MKVLVDAGMMGFTIKDVARRVGVSDMAVNHHFSQRDALIVAASRELGRRLSRELEEVTTSWLRQCGDIELLVRLLSDFYDSGRAGVALELHETGWREYDKTPLAPVAELLHQRREQVLRTRVDPVDTKMTIAALHQALAVDYIFGGGYRRGVGLGALVPNESVQVHASESRTAHRRWWVETLTARLESVLPTATPWTLR